jgi:hypothetical protein
MILVPAISWFVVIYLHKSWQDTTAYDWIDITKRKYFNWHSILSIPIRVRYTWYSIQEHLPSQFLLISKRFGFWCEHDPLRQANLLCIHIQANARLEFSLLLQNLFTDLINFVNYTYFYVIMWFWLRFPTFQKVPMLSIGNQLLCLVPTANDTYTIQIPRE